MRNSREYMITTEKIQLNAGSMRDRTLEILFDSLSQKISYRHVVDMVRITPPLGERGGEKCEEKHVWPALRHIQWKLEARHSGYKLIVDRDNKSALLVKGF
jgi:hypothetical protein